jgi:hypothetical protein
MRWWLVLAIACSSPKPAPIVANRAAGSAVAVPRAPAGRARLVVRTQTGGVIELAGDREIALQRSMDLMTTHCGPQNFTIVQEGEEAVASEGDAITTAWRIHYQCGS